MKNTKTLALATLAALAMTATTEATLYNTITLTQGQATLTLNNLRNHPLDNQGGRGSLAWNGNHMHQLWFWYREANQTREYALSNQIDDSWVSGNEAMLHYIQALPGGATQMIDVTLNIKLEKIFTSNYRLRVVWKVRNLSPAIAGFPNRLIRFFSYADIDAGGTPLNACNFPQEDKFYFNGTNANASFEATADDPDVWRSEIAPLSGAAGTTLMDRLTNASMDDLNLNLGQYNPLVDRAAAFEHAATLNPNQLMQGTIYVNTTMGTEFSTPEGMSMYSGEMFGGDLNSLNSTDGNAMQMLPDLTGETLVALYDHVTFRSPDLLRLSMSQSATRPGTAYSLYVFNWVAYQWQFWNGAVTPTTTTLTYLDKSASAGGTAQFIDASNGALSAYIRWAPVNDEDPSADGWVTSLDQFQYTLYP